MSKIHNASVGEIIKRRTNPPNHLFILARRNEPGLVIDPGSHPPQDGLTVNEDEDFED